MSGKGAKAMEAVHDFWTWWSDELREMLPNSLRGEPTERDRFDLFMTDGETIIETVHHGAGRKMQEACSLEELPVESWEQIAEYAEVRKARLFLDDSDFLVLPVKLPRASASQLRSALALQLPNLVPMEPHLLDWNYVELDRNDLHIELALIIAKSERLDALEDLFTRQELMPPAFYAKHEHKTVTLRKPLEIARKPLEDRKMQIAMAMAVMLAMIPVLTIGGARMMTSIEIDRAASLEEELAPRLSAEKIIAREEMTRRAASPLLNMPSASNRLEKLAQNLPETDWTVSAEQQPDGSFEFVADMLNREETEIALQETTTLSRLELTEELESEAPRHRARYRASR